MDSSVRLIIDVALRSSLIVEDIEKKHKVSLTEKQCSYLEKLANRTHVKLQHKNRAKIILASDRGLSNVEEADELGIHLATVSLWVNRWIEIAPEINVIEVDKPFRLKRLIEFALEDAYRSGVPTVFSEEQTARIINLATDKPEKYNVMADIWSLSLLVKTAVELGYVDSISKTTVWRMFCDFF